MSTRIIILFSLLTFAKILSFASVESRVAEADSAYSIGNYPKAAELYKNVADEVGVSPTLLHNLGNCYVKAGDYAKATIAYVNALKIDPSAKDVRLNLKYVESKVADNNRAELKGKKVSVTPDEPSFFANIKNLISRRVSSNTWAVWGMVSFLILMICVSLYLFTNRVLLRKIGFFGGIIFFLFTILFLIFSYTSRAALFLKEDAVITSYKISLHTEPIKSSPLTAYPLTRGTVVKIIDERGDNNQDAEWYKIRLNSDYVGWVESSNIEIL